MADQTQRPPYPQYPQPPYPVQGMQGAVPRPPVMPPHPPIGVKMPAGVKMPPRPMGYPMSAGVKVPPRPMGVAPVPPAAPSAQVDSIDEMWDETPAADEPVVDENGFIDDLPPDDAAEPAPVEEPVLESGMYDENMASDLGLPPAFVKTKFLLPMFLIVFLIGAAGGFFYSRLQPAPEEELPGVVQNAEIPKGRPRCGIAQKGQGCVLYLMNAQRREIEAKEFFTMASDILGVPRFQIETSNIRYAPTRVPPGYIALINVPPVQ